MGKWLNEYKIIYYTISESSFWQFKWNKKKRPFKTQYSTDSYSNFRITLFATANVNIWYHSLKIIIYV
jgi:hypothetical protein